MFSKLFTRCQTSAIVLKQIYHSQTKPLLKLPPKSELCSNICSQVSMLVKVCQGGKRTIYKVEEIPDSYADLGEAPHWHMNRESLYYVDLNAGKLLRYDYNNNRIFKCKIDGANSSTFIIPVDGTEDQFVVGNQRSVELVRWDGESSSCCIEQSLFNVQQESHLKQNRLNDAKCDPMGRLFAGTMCTAGNEFDHRLGELYRYDNGKVKTVLHDLGISNGLAWNRCGTKFYFIDMADHDVKEFDYDLDRGILSNKRVVYNWRKTDIPQHLLLPDGMTIDTDGNIYVAVFNGGTIYKINPRSGDILLEIKLPCKQITSCAFGGPCLDILYVTTSSRFDEPSPAGMLYRVTGLGAQGIPMNGVKIPMNCN